MKTHASSLVFALTVLTQATAVAVTLYPSDAAFNAAFPALPVEDFEKGAQGFGGLENTFGTMGNPLDSSTSNTFFIPGDIQNGLRITANTVGGVSVDNILIAAPGYFGNTSHAISYVSANTLSPELTLFFYSGNVNEVGLELTSSALNDVFVSVFSGVTSLGVFAVNDLPGTGTFFGVSSADPITKLTLSGKTAADDFIGIDNIAFGAATVSDVGSTVSMLVRSMLALTAARGRITNRKPVSS